MVKSQVAAVCVFLVTRAQDKHSIYKHLACLLPCLRLNTNTVSFNTATKLSCDLSNEAEGRVGLNQTKMIEFSKL